MDLSDNELIDDPTEYNPQRVRGTIRTTASVEDLLDRFDRDQTPGRRWSRRQSEDSGETIEIEKVKRFLDRQGLPTARIDLFEHPLYGTVQIATAGLSRADFDSFIDLMRTTEGIGYDSEAKRNYCDPAWVAQLPMEAKEAPQHHNHGQHDSTRNHHD